MSEEESENSKQSEELDNQEHSEPSPKLKQKPKARSKGGTAAAKAADNKEVDNQSAKKAASADNPKCKDAKDKGKATGGSTKIWPIDKGEQESDNSSDNSAISSQQATGVSSGVVPVPGLGARMTFDGGAVSDDEDNSWEDSVSDSDGSAGRDDYYDQEDYDEESPSPLPKKARKAKSPGEEIKDGSLGQDQEKKVQPEEEEEEAEKSGPLYMNLYCTEYDVIKKVARKVLGYKLREYPEDHDGAIRKGEHNQKLVKEWDVSWHDLSITPDFLAKLNPWQKVNHYPGMYAITRKNHLARNLMRMKRAFQEEFNFFPQTWVLPGDNIDFRNQFIKPTDGQKKKKRQTYIVKPDGLAQGKGIFLSRRMEKILQGIDSAKEEEGIGGWVVQHYLDTPHLIDELKYDLRIYVLLNSVNPLRVYIHEEGLARFATEPYRKPTARNMDNLFMHLTNYAINKFSSAYQAGEDESSGEEESGHKRSLKAIMNILQACGANKAKLMMEIKDIIVKTMATAQPNLAHLYRSCQPEDLDNSMCFQILGFDIMIDRKFKPWLIEVNQSPSFATDSPLDYKTKKAVLTDTFRMLNCSVSRRKKLLKKQQEQMESRILTGKQAKMDPEEKNRLRQEMLDERDAFEMERKGQWERIYPWPEEERNQIYSDYIKKANEIFDDFTTGKGKRLQSEARRSQLNNNASNLNRQGTSKAGFGSQKGSTISVTGGSSHNLRTQSFGKNFQPFKSGQSSKELAGHSSQNQMQLKVQVPASSSNTALSNRSFSAKNKAAQHQQPIQSNKQLEIIHQASVEEFSPLIKAKMLTMDKSEESLGDAAAKPTAKPFRLSLQGGSLRSNQAVPSNQNVSMNGKLQRQAQPSNFDQSPKIFNVNKTQQMRLHEQAEKILSQVQINQHYKQRSKDAYQSKEDKLNAMKRQQLQDSQAQRGKSQTSASIVIERARDEVSASATHNRMISQNDPARISQQQWQAQQELELFQGMTGNSRQPSQLYHRNNKDGLYTAVGSGANAARRNPLHSHNISTDGRQSFQIAGSNQMNFLTATNNSTAQINREQQMSQVPSWLVNMKESNVIAEANAQKDSMLHQARLTQKRQNQVAHQAYENLKNKKVSSVTPEVMMLTSNKPAHLTEQKTSKNLQQVIMFEEDLIKLAAAEKANAQSFAFSSADNSTVFNAMQKQPVASSWQSQNQKQRVSDQSDNQQNQNWANQRLLPANTTVSSNGFPTVSTLQDVAEQRQPRALSIMEHAPHKQALKMAQIPIFLADTSGQQRNKIKSKGTPQQKNHFKAALAGVPGFAHHGSIGSKTVVKTTSPKLEGLPTTGAVRFEPHTVQHSKKHMGNLKPKPNYHGVATQDYQITSQFTEGDQQYFQRRNQPTDNEILPSKKQRAIQGSLPVSSLPFKPAPDINSLQLVQQAQSGTSSTFAEQHSQNQNTLYKKHPQQRVEIGGSEDYKPCQHQQQNGLTTMSGAQQVSSISSGQEAGVATGTMSTNHSYHNHQRVPITSSANHQMASAASSWATQQKTPPIKTTTQQLTPFQLFQQQQQKLLQQHHPQHHHQPRKHNLTQQQQQQQQSQSNSKYGKQLKQQSANRPSAIPAKYQQDRDDEGSSVSSPQQNQFILQKNNNFRQGLYQQEISNSNQQQQHQQQYLMTSSHNGITSSSQQQQPQYDKPHGQQQLLNDMLASGHGVHQHAQKKYNSSLNGFNNQQSWAPNSNMQVPQQQVNNAKKVRTNTSKGDLAKGGNGAHNRRLGRALGQGKSQGVASVSAHGVAGIKKGPTAIVQNGSSQLVYGNGNGKSNPSDISNLQIGGGATTTFFGSVGSTKQSVGGAVGGVIGCGNQNPQASLSQNNWRQQRPKNPNNNLRSQGGYEPQIQNDDGSCLHSLTSNNDPANAKAKTNEPNEVNATQQQQRLMPASHNKNEQPVKQKPSANTGFRKAVNSTNEYADV